MLVRLRRPIIACSSSFADYKPKTNAAILLDMIHTKGRLHGRYRVRKGNQKLECD
jgi:hypothetical protein